MAGEFEALGNGWGDGGKGAARQIIDAAAVAAVEVVVVVAVVVWNVVELGVRRAGAS